MLIVVKEISCCFFAFYKVLSILETLGFLKPYLIV